jgi:hypothetical protein
MNHPVKFRLYLLAKIPSAFFSGLRVVNMTEQACVVTVPYKWFSQNPFKCTYFACLAMAGEMSTGSLGMAYTFKRKPQVSMLVLKVEANYFKKANSLTYFTCSDGTGFEETVARAIATGEPQSFTAKSTGTNKAGDVVAELFVTWSFKAKKQ